MVNAARTALAPGIGSTGTPSAKSRADQLIARVRQEGGAGIGDQGHRLTRPQPLQYRGQPGLLVVGVQAHHRGVDARMRQQLAGAAGILGGNHASLAQHPQRPQRDVLQVADGGRHDEQTS